ncbi:MAG: hypothetical protein IJT03_00445 [Clostridia bacterium]|nr:hypothetical protein [Clostridia bacterium]
MNDMLRTILEADKAAQERVREVEKYRRDSIAGLESQKEKIKDQELKKAKDSAVRRSERLSSRGEKYLTGVQEKNREAIDRMNSLYDTDFEKWVGDIVEKVTAVD